jgi:hypothetical protein
VPPDDRAVPQLEALLSHAPARIITVLAEAVRCRGLIEQAARHRGVATAMTSAALVWAREAGAREAGLDAGAAGLSIYLRLGSKAVATSTLFARFS